MPDACLPDGGVRSIPALAQWAAARYGDAEAVVDGTTRLTFREVAALARRATRGAIAQGIEPGDRVAIWAPNSWEWIVAALGALGAGAWLVPVNTRFKGDEAAYVLDRSGAVALFTVRGFLDTDYVALLRDAAPDLPCLEHPVLLAGAHDDEATLDDFLAAGDTVDDADALARIDALGTRRRGRRDLHVGHHRPTQGRDAGARRVAARVRPVGAAVRAARRRPLPRGQPVLPLLRVQGGVDGVPAAGRHCAPSGHPRPRPGPRAGGHRAGVGAARATHTLHLAARRAWR